MTSEPVPEESIRVEGELRLGRHAVLDRVRLVDSKICPDADEVQLRGCWLIRCDLSEMQPRQIAYCILEDCVLPSGPLVDTDMTNTVLIDSVTGVRVMTG